MVFENFRDDHATGIRKGQKVAKQLASGAGLEVPIQFATATMGWHKKRELRETFVGKTNQGMRKYNGEDMSDKRFSRKDLLTAFVYAIHKTGVGRNHKYASMGASGFTVAAGGTVGQMLIPIPGVGLAIGVGITNLVSFGAMQAFRKAKWYYKKHRNTLGAHRKGAAFQIWHSVRHPEKKTLHDCSVLFAKKIMGDHSFNYALGQVAEGHQKVGEDFLAASLASW